MTGSIPLLTILFWFCGFALSSRAAAFIQTTTTTACHSDGLLSRPRTCRQKDASRQYSALYMTKLKNQESLKVGFVGCGTIAAAIATGLAVQERLPIESIAVSERSRAKSTALRSKFPELVTVHSENQNVIDESDIVFLCVLPQQTNAVLESLEFDATRHTLVSLVSTSILNELVDASGLPNKQVYKMICLPSVQRLEGTCLVLPKRGDALLTSMFESLGGCVECETQDIMNAMMIPTALMGPLYGTLVNTRDWLVKQNVPAEDASYFVGRQYWGMMQDAVRDCKNPDFFNDLVEEQTPGGLNEQALNNLKDMGVFDAYDKAMDAILSRLEGRSDGSLQ